jgi:hypothetical protein
MSINLLMIIWKDYIVAAAHVLDLLDFTIFVECNKRCPVAIVDNSHVNAQDSFLQATTRGPVNVVSITSVIMRRGWLCHLRQWLFLAECKVDLQMAPPFQNHNVPMVVLLTFEVDLLQGPTLAQNEYQRMWNYPSS